VAVTDAQGWTLLGMVGVLMSVIGGLIVNQFHLLRGHLDARFMGLESAVDARFDGVDRRLDHLDRDVQALMRDRFDRD
jgi:hypothetical protein